MVSNKFNFKSITKPVKTAAAVLITIITIVATIFAVDDRYANAEDLLNLKSSIAQQLEIMQSQIKRNQINQRIAYLEDQIFILEFKENNDSLDPLDKALLERYRREIRTLNNQHYY